jgi:predicted hydrolase (HD superfamily)
LKGSEILKERGYSDDIRKAILGHASFSNVPRESLMAKVLFACDELCGFITAVAVIRPNKITDLEISSVKKKLKDKSFAKNVSREDIELGIKELGLPLEEHIKFVSEAMKADAERLGLKP